MGGHLFIRTQQESLNSQEVFRINRLYRYLSFSVHNKCLHVRPDGGTNLNARIKRSFSMYLYKDLLFCFADKCR